MNGHKSDYRRSLDGDLLSDTSTPYSHFKYHDVKIFKFHALEFLENNGLNYNYDIRQI